MDFHQFIRSRRSVRRFKPDPVPEAAIERMLMTATSAPSSRYVLVNALPRAPVPPVIIATLSLNLMVVPRLPNI